MTTESRMADTTPIAREELMYSLSDPTPTAGSFEIL